MEGETNQIGEATEQYDVMLEDVDTGVVRPRKTKLQPEKKKRGSGWQDMGLAGQIGFDVALPMVLGLVGGTKLDALWGTRPKATLVLFGFGIIIACTSLIRIVRDSTRTR